MTKYQVELLTSLKGSSGSSFASSRKIYPSGAVFVGTLEDFPKDIADAVRGKERYVKVTEIQVQEPVEKVHNFPEINYDEVIDPNLSVKTAVTDETEVNEGQSTGNAKPDDTEHSEDNLKDKIKKAGSKLLSKE